jgi:hypothetical protein
MVWEARMVPCENAITAVAMTTTKVGRRRTRTPTSTTLVTVTRSTKNRPASMATAVPVTVESAAKGSIHSVIAGG